MDEEYDCIVLGTGLKVSADTSGEEINFYRGVSR